MPRGNGLECQALRLKRPRKAPTGEGMGGYLFSTQILAQRPCRAAPDLTMPSDPQGCPSRPLPGQVVHIDPDRPARGVRFSICKNPPEKRFD